MLLFLPKILYRKILIEIIVRIIGNQGMPKSEYFNSSKFEIKFFILIRSNVVCITILNISNIKIASLRFVMYKN